eukprot:620995-Pyramimonas_sp.AAC.1
MQHFLQQRCCICKGDPSFVIAVYVTTTGRSESHNRRRLIVETVLTLRKALVLVLVTLMSATSEAVLRMASLASSAFASTAAARFDASSATCARHIRSIALDINT